MSESARERLYWYLALLAWLLAILNVSALAPVPVPFDSSKALLVVGVIGGVFWAALMGIVLEILVCLLRGHLPRNKLFLQRASGAGSSTFELPLDEARQAIEGRLIQLGFTRISLPNSNPDTLAFTKASAPGGPVRYIDNAFDAVVELTPQGSRTAAKITITQRSTILFETGELSLLAELSEYVLLQRAEFTTPPRVPFTALTGVSAGLAMIGFTFCRRAWADWPPVAISISAFATFIYGLGAFLQIRRDRSHLIGLRLAVVAMSLAIVPFLLSLLRVEVHVTRLQVAIGVTLVVGGAPMCWQFWRTKREYQRLQRSSQPVRLWLWRNVAFLEGFILGFAGLTFAGACLLLVQAWTTGPLSTMSAESLEAGKAPDSNWLEISGDLELDRGWWISEHRNKQYYIPLVSKDRHRGALVAVLVSLSEKEFEAERAHEDSFSNQEAVRGMIDEAGLPDAVRTGLQSAGIAPAKNAIVLHYHLTPQLLRQRTTPVFLMSLAGTVLWAITGLVARRLRPIAVEHTATTETLTPALSRSTGRG